jgi:hypothetical protein
MLEFAPGSFPRAPAALALAAVLLAGCATGPTIRSDYDRSADFSAYRTYAYVDKVGTDRPEYGSLVTQHFKNVIDAQMSARGFRKVEQNPDLLVNFNANAEEKVDVQSTPTPAPTLGVGIGYGGYYGYRGGLYAGWPAYTTDVQTVRYQVGTMNIDVVDAKRKQLVWEGVGEGRLKKETLRNPQPAIQKAVALVFEQFPVKPAGTAPAR